MDVDLPSLLSSEKAKRKRYILFLYTMTPDSEQRIRIIEKTINFSLEDFIIVKLDDPDEGLKILLVKNIEIILIDSSLFYDDVISIEYALECKKRKPCPVLFIANHSDILINKYRETLYAFEECDDYFDEPLDYKELSGKLKQFAGTSGRMAKRFSLNIPIEVYRLNKDKKYSCTLTDISLIGFGISLIHEEVFQIKEQVGIKLPLEPFQIFHKEYGQFLSLSGKLRRVSLDGRIMGFSIEFATPMQIEVLVDVINRATKKMQMLRFMSRNQ